MKRFSILLAIIGIILAMISCQKEPLLTLNTPNAISFPEQGGNQDITFSTNRNWTVTSSESWCKVSSESGVSSENGNSIRVTCEQNTTYDPRSCTVTITAGGLTQIISVSQETNQGLLVSPTSFNLSDEAQTIEVEVRANVKYTIDIDSSCKDWIKHVSTRALSTNTFVFDVAENSTFNDRVGSITFRQADGLLAETVTIHQKQIEVHF